MTTYEKAVRFLMVDMVKDLKMQKESVLTKRDAIEWFRNKYPAIDQKTVECHLTRLSVNAPSRLHYHAVPREDDVLFKIDSNHFRLYDTKKDQAPIWSEKQAPTIGSRKPRPTKRYEDQIANLLDNLDKLHDQFYMDKIFAGPSLYFHRRALQSKDAEGGERTLEYIYATLASWGMHRMGKGGSKMLDFETFKNSVVGLEREIEAATKIDYETVTEANWELLQNIFCNTKVMKSKTSIVGNSKVMAHLIPNIVPPIDRAYTIRYLKETIRNGHEYEWPLMRNVIENFFIPVASEERFLSRSKNWTADRDRFPWDTSDFKIIDNLIIAAVSREKAN